MNILFDLVSTQGTINGGGEYVKTVFLALMDRIMREQLPNVVFAMYNSADKMAFDALQIEDVTRFEQVKLVDVAGKSVPLLAEELKIDIFFIGIAQKIAKYHRLDGLKCRTVCVIHDMAHQEAQKCGTATVSCTE